jgi:hypothetical protein
MPGVRFAPYGDLAAARKLIRKGKTAAVFTPLLAFQAQVSDTFGVTDPGQVPRIIYVARTHPQLDNTCTEMATYPYEVLAAAPVSKEHLCLQPREDGMSAIRAWYVYQAVKHFAGSAAAPKALDAPQPSPSPAKAPK